MKIIWNQNPLRTKVILDDYEKKELWHKIKIEQLEDLLVGAHCYLIEGKRFNLKKAQQDVDPKFYTIDDPKKSPLDKQVDNIFKYMISDLEHNSHMGDCTCFACSCGKCHAESLLNIDTIAGLGKHEAYNIECTFKKGDSYKEEDERTLDEVISLLENFEPKGTWDGWEAHADSWRAQGRRACEWLKKYRDLHFPLLT